MKQAHVYNKKMHNKILSVSNTFNYLTIDPFIPVIFAYDIKDLEKINQFKVIECITYFKLCLKPQNEAITAILNI